MKRRLANSNEQIAMHYRLAISDYATVQLNRSLQIGNVLPFANRKSINISKYTDIASI